ncbi:galactosyltransferase-related protein [uncultured Duncaniella sp.]|uniref:galactosyltransferase-related protein n=1 Tax=uncultured Duncaniella sp. TaxID=2768039 RepID=UPI0025A54297|nr:galactosyltransferase-related protein [uncultured Duncaniella sp.]
MTRSHLPDLTIMMSTRIDSPDRLANVRASLGYYRKYTDAHLMIIESDSKSRLSEIMQMDFPEVEYIFVEDHNPMLHRTHLMNEEFRRIRTRNAANIDVDIIVPIEQLHQAHDAVLSGQYVMSMPYDGRVVLSPKELADIFRETLDIGALTEIDAYQQLMFGFASLGGAYVVDVARYRELGWENEHFLCWGPEDMERFHRLDILGHRPLQVTGKCYHLPHSRGINSGDTVPELILLTKREYFNVINMKPQELCYYIESWTWCKR